MSGQDNVVNFKRPREWADDCAALWFHLQELKKKMRRQFIEDFKTMISKNASTEELLDRLLKHERARRTTRDAHNVERRTLRRSPPTGNWSGTWTTTEYPRNTRRTSYSAGR